MSDTASGWSVVTGAFGYTGKTIARRLLAAGQPVKTITGHPRRPNPFGDRIAVEPLDFEDSAGLRDSLRGATTLYNTYWVRFEHGSVTFAKAIENTRRLLDAAVAAGVRRIVHLSVSNATAGTSLPYFEGKAEVEREVIGSGLSYAIIRPTVVFGDEDILINNIAWLLRHLPVFGVPGSGAYRLRPIFVEDLARIAVEAGHREDNLIVDAVGPEVYTFDELVRFIAETVGSGARIFHVPPPVALLLCRLVGCVVRDIVLTREELAGLMANLLDTDGPPAGETRFSEWLRANAATVGARYRSELRRHYV